MDSASPPPESGTGSARLAVIDGLRGLALAGMVVFHAGWDMAHFGLLPGDGALPSGWQIYGHVVASLFLALSGFGLVLADRRGLGLNHALRRLALVAVAALGVSFATWLAVPEDFIFFGILHCIAVGNALSLPLIRAPFVLVVAVAALFLAVPLAAPLALVDGPGWVWLGLSGHLPNTLDFRPLLPWAGLIVAGLLAGRLLPERWLRRVDGGSKFWRGLCWAGRHSLAVYLLHQALLFPAVYGVSQAIGARPADWSASFARQCRADCQQTRAGTRVCEAACDCARTWIRQGPRAHDFATQSITPADRQALAAIAGTCLRDSLP